MFMRLFLNLFHPASQTISKKKLEEKLEIIHLFLTLFFILGESRLLTDASVSLLPQSIIFGLDDFYSQDDDGGKMF